MSIKLSQYYRQIPMQVPAYAVPPSDLGRDQWVAWQEFFNNAFDILNQAQQQDQLSQAQLETEKGFDEILLGLMGGGGGGGGMVGGQPRSQDLWQHRRTTPGGSGRSMTAGGLVGGGTSSVGGYTN